MSKYDFLSIQFECRLYACIL